MFSALSLPLSHNSRNLKGNDLTFWEEEFVAYLPSLASLDITGNSVFPRRQILQSLSLEEIKGVTWNDDCTNCKLLRNGDVSGIKFPEDLTIEDLKSGGFMKGLRGDCRADEYSVKNTSMTFAKHGFFPACVAQKESCFHSEISVTPIHRCWETDNNILNAEFLIGTLGVLLNVTVFVNIFSKKSLRNNVSLLLMSNMAISDFMISVYSVALTSARQLTYVKFLPTMPTLCRCLGLLWLLGQVVTVMTSVLLTLERYFAVTHFARPTKRMTLRRACTGIVCCWLVALVLALLPLVGVGVYTSNTYCVPIRPRRDIPYMFEFSVGLTLLAIVLYSVTLPLYLKMYLFVRSRVRQRARVNHESALAKRIALLVISNMLFFIFPVMVSLLWLASDTLQNLPTSIESVLTGVIPTVCFSINSLINPLLSAFRHDRFKKALRERFQGLSSCCCSRRRCTSATGKRGTEGHKSNHMSPSRGAQNSQDMREEYCLATPEKCRCLIFHHDRFETHAQIRKKSDTNTAVIQQDLLV